MLTQRARSFMVKTPNEEQLIKSVMDKILSSSSFMDTLSENVRSRIDGSMRQCIGEYAEKVDALEAEIHRLTSACNKMEQFSRINNLRIFEIPENVDELYTELLYEILHNVGCDATCDINQADLFLYLQEAFKMSNERHQELFAEAQRREPPKPMLNVEVIEAKDLKRKDTNGLRDPFVTLFLLSNPNQRYNTSVQTNTLCPVWEEQFPVPISRNPDDMLCMEVWDLDSIESVRDKMKKVFDIKGIKGAGKFMKDIALTTARQQENRLLGCAKIPLSSIPVNGMTVWHSLDKSQKITRQGRIKVRLAFSSTKKTQVAAQEYKQLLRVLLLHELENSTVAQYWWPGTFSDRSNALLSQHIAQSGLQPVDLALAQWNVYAAVHQNHPLSFTLFSTLLDKLLKPLQTPQIPNEEKKLFWDSASKLLPSLFSVVRKIRRKCANEKASIKQLSDVLRILAKLDSLSKAEDVDLFPPRMYPWITTMEGDWSISSVLREAVIRSTSERFNHIMENNARRDYSDIGKLLYLNKITQEVHTDLKNAIGLYGNIFMDNMRFAYGKTIYTIYQAEIAALIKPDVVDICKSLKRLSYVGFAPSEENSAEPLSVGTSLFELYLALQKFLAFGTELCPDEIDNLQIHSFNGWFSGGVTQWLEIAVFKALLRIEKAVDLDSLTPIDEKAKHSSSAVDTLTVFHQIKVLWEQLNWPLVEDGSVFISKVIDDLSKCTVFYADKMLERVDGIGNTGNKFEATPEWCLAINNIDHLRQSLRSIAEDLGRELPDQQKLDDVIQSAINNVRNKINELLETVVSKMCPAMKRFLVEGAEVYQQDRNSIDRVMVYVDNNLETLNRELNEDNFKKTLLIIWDKVSDILKELLQSNADKRRPPSFFANLHEMLNIMLKSFKSSDSCGSEELKRIEKQLKLNGMETASLIHQVHLDMWKEQNHQRAESEYGQLTVRLKFQGNDLHIEVMNCKNLAPMNSNSTCDSFVKIHLLPKEKFVGVISPKTQTHNKEKFPLYDETFIIPLSEDQQNTRDALVLFSVKNYTLGGYNNQYIGEAFVQFKDIPNGPEPLGSLEQVTLQLIRPSTMKIAVLEALEYRQGDKQAKEFLKKMKQRMGTNGDN